VLASIIVASGDRYLHHPETQTQLFRHILDSVRALPGVESAGTVDALPFSGENNGAWVTATHSGVARPDTQPIAEVDYVSDGYLETMGVQVLQGRLFRALPGGFFFVNSGLILKAESEAELAGVMAHEIAHVAARHGTKQATRGEIVQIGMIAAGIVVPYSVAGYGALQGANALIPVGFLKFSRSMEREADYLGLQYLYKTGYDPTAFVDFFEKIESMEKKKPGTVAKVFSTHPMTDDRIQAAQAEIQKVLVAKPEYLVNTSEFNDMKARLGMLHNRRKPKSEDPNRPRLRSAPGAGTGTGNDSGQKPDSDERPTLKRRADE
jgi:hypothetical protein